MSPLFSGSMISLRELFENVNPKDGRFLKYVPDGFLNEEQKKSKKIAFERQEKEYQKFNKEKRTNTAETEAPIMKSGRLAVSALNNSISNEGEKIKLNLGTKQELDTAEKRIKDLERINKSLREQMRLTPEGKADPGTLRRAAKHLMQE